MNFLKEVKALEKKHEKNQQYETVNQRLLQLETEQSGLKLCKYSKSLKILKYIYIELNIELKKCKKKMTKTPQDLEYECNKYVLFFLK